MTNEGFNPQTTPYSFCPRHTSTSRFDINYNLCRSPSKSCLEYEHSDSLWSEAPPQDHVECSSRPTVRFAEPAPRIPAPIGCRRTSCGISYASRGPQPIQNNVQTGPTVRPILKPTHVARPPTPPRRSSRSRRSSHAADHYDYYFDENASKFDYEYGMECAAYPGAHPFARDTKTYRLASRSRSRSRSRSHS